jgi:hypothetical protein
VETLRLSFQGIALAMPQTLRNQMPLLGARIDIQFFQHPLSAIQEVFWCGV